MGHVFLGRDPELDRPVAIKTVRDLKMDEAARATFLERFKNEARAAARLHHPNIVQVYDVGEMENGSPYLVFEYVAGSTLKQVVRGKGPMSPERVVQVADEIAEALTVAHEHGIIHRDIKPDNLLVTPDGQVKLADFGVARVPNAALTREGQFLGTPCYAAPETLSKGQYGTHSDIFSFAAVIYEIVSGARAFPGDDAVSVAHKVVHEVAPPPSEVAKGDPIPPEVDGVIMQGLEKSAEGRFESARDLALAVREAYEAAGVVELPARSSTRSIRIQTHTREEEDPGSTWGFIALLVGALAVGIAIIFAFTGDQPDLTDGADAGALDFDPNAETRGTTTGATGVGGEVPGVTPDGGTAPVPNTRPDPFDRVDPTQPTNPSGDPGDPGVGGEVSPTGDPATGGEPGETGPDPDAGVVDEPSPVDQMSAHEREEAAKDALDATRVALTNSDVQGARQSLEAARLFDPENPDIEDLQRRVVDAEGTAGQ